MATKKTSAEAAREQAEEAALGSMLDGAFGAMEGIEATPPSEGPQGPPAESPTDTITEPSPGPTGGPPTGPPTGPPGGPPTGPPTGPPGSPPTKSPTGPSGGPPTGPPSEPSTEEMEKTTEENDDSEETKEAPETTTEESSSTEDEDPKAAEKEENEVVEEMEVTAEEEAVEDEDAGTSETSADSDTDSSKQTGDAAESPTESEPSESEDSDEANLEPLSDESSDDVEREMEIARLTAEIERLRGSLVGAAEVIEEIEEVPMPPVVLDNIVVPPHLVADFARMGRQLSREGLVKGAMGSISMLHPDEPGLMISTRHSTMLARLDDRGIIGGRLGGDSPRGSITDWKVHEVLLASVALVTGGPAACIHMQGPYTTAASCEKDLILVQPIDVLGREQIGKVVIVDPDDDAQEEFLRQVAEALQQGGMRCVVVRGHGAYAVGANLDQAMANAAMLEHSMHILLLARQANLKL
ncbi:MAG: hypothetical protein CMA67_05265 [Euryarchaeota archaeon]|nr:hypothetical protein [Euryarchaeota archaeon]